MKYYKIQEVAEMLSLSRQTIYKYIKEGKIKTTDVAGNPRISKEEVEKMIDNE